MKSVKAKTITINVYIQHYNHITPEYVVVPNLCKEAFSKMTS